MERHGLPKSVGAMGIEMVVRYDSVTRNEIMPKISLTKGPAVLTSAAQEIRSKLPVGRLSADGAPARFRNWNFR